MTYRVELAPPVLYQLADLPVEVAYALADCLAVVAVDPRNPTVTEPTSSPDVREAVFGEYGIVAYLIREDQLVIVALNLIWAG